MATLKFKFFHHEGQEFAESDVMLEDGSEYSQIETTPIDSTPRIRCDHSEIGNIFMTVMGKC